ncbi:FAD-binding protein [Candidatus Sodalis endolongispinus]|uniref:FAD-binding protein n=1 Tax=Candidatus Sodalis endolongispinus TaxID=2812662 RepID=UPI001FE39F01|nr:FAD-binding protein [Candidatus Sodalis endolongispinus]
MMNQHVDNAAPQADDTQHCDVLVVVSGGAALSAALTAAVAGLKVLIVEKAATVGGTTAMSGGAVWVPANHHALAQGGTGQHCGGVDLSARQRCSTFSNGIRRCASN